MTKKNRRQWNSNVMSSNSLLFNASSSVVFDCSCISKRRSQVFLASALIYLSICAVRFEHANFVTQPLLHLNKDFPLSISRTNQLNDIIIIVYYSCHATHWRVFCVLKSDLDTRVKVFDRCYETRIVRSWWRVCVCVCVFEKGSYVGDTQSKNNDRFEYVNFHVRILKQCCKASDISTEKWEIFYIRIFHDDRPICLKGVSSLISFHLFFCL